MARGHHSTATIEPAAPNLMADAWAAAWRAAAIKADTPLATQLVELIGTSCRYAAVPFAMAQDGDRAWLLANLAPPPSFDPEAVLAWRPDGDVVAIDPETGNAWLCGEQAGWFVGHADEAQARLFSDGRRWARAWAHSRASALATWRRARVPSLPMRDPLHHGLPGLLIAGDARRVVDWGPVMRVAQVRCDNPRMVPWLSQRLLAAARIPSLGT